MQREVPIVYSLNPFLFAGSEHEILKSPSYSVSAFRYRSGVEAIRINSGRGEFIWLPFLGQQIWDWKVDGKSQKFEGFVKEPSYGRNFLQNYGGFLIHCGMTAMGNPAAKDTHPQHGELPVARFDEAWIEMARESGHEVLALSGRLHWHVPFVAEYNLSTSILITSDGLSLHADLHLENPTSRVMDYMYLAHINFAFSGADRILSTVPLDSGRTVIWQEIIPGSLADPGLIKKIDESVLYEPELVAIVDDRDIAGESVGSVLSCSDGTSRWVRQETPALDHHVIWMTHNPDRGACGFHLPSTAGPAGFEAEKVQGNLKHLMPGGSVDLRYSCGYSDSLDGAPVKGAE